MSELKPCQTADVEDAIGYMKQMRLLCDTDDGFVPQVYDLAIDALRRAQPTNEPLTLEQLREMDGEPVWCADGEGHSCYCLVNAGNEDCIDSECGAWCFGFYGMTGDGENGLHNMGWLAYAHKPGGEQDA